MLDLVARSREDRVLIECDRLYCNVSWPSAWPPTLSDIWRAIRVAQ